MSDAGTCVCVTVDLDSLACYRDIHGLEQRREDADAAYEIGVRRLLEFFDGYGIDATLFVIGRDTRVDAHSDILRTASDAGHELGNHSYSHFYDLPERSTAEIVADIERGEVAIERVSGARPVGYRAPGYNITGDVYDIVARRGYLYDSSIFPCPPYYLAKGAIMGWQAVRGRPSRSSMTPARNLLAPIGAYRPRRGRIWQADPNATGPVEVPMALVPGIRFPVIGTSLHVMGRRGFDLAYPWLRRAYPTLFQLEFHAIDFMDADDPGTEDLVDVQPDLAVDWADKRALYGHVFDRLLDDYDRSATLADAVRSLYD